jgi:nicotinamidase/pyrazinamidase
MAKREKGKLFWDVDTQFDFLNPEGRLYVPGSETIIPNLRLLTSWAADHAVLVVSSACAHLPGDPELSIYGPHCMVGTPGQQKISATLLPNRFTVPNRPISLPKLSSFRQFIIEKQAFDVFTNPNTDAILRELGAGLRIVLYGVATDICVASAANSLLNRGHHVELVKEAIAALDMTKAKDVLKDFTARGGKLASIDDVVTSVPAA